MASTLGSTDAVARVPRTVAFRHDALPLTLADGVLVVALADPADGPALDALHAATRLRIRPVAMPRETIRERLRSAYGDAPLGGERTAEAPAVVAADRVLSRAITAHASDVHIEPAGDGGGRVRVRVDGILRELELIPAALFPAVCSRLKLLAGMDVADRRRPQDGRFAIPAERGDIDARVASVPGIDGEALVIRLLARTAEPPELGSLGMSDALLARYTRIVSAPSGFVVVVGPTGSGKTTTLYASLGALDAEARNLCSVEDPVEMRLARVTQVQVNDRAEVTFPRVVRAFMRQDPDVIMVGEVRDEETARAAVSAALAGGAVFATLHASDAPRAIDRLVELGVARNALAGAITGVLAQRLVRTLCERCRQRAADSARACAACDGTGYAGRTGLYELLDVDDTLRDAIASGASAVGLAALAATRGYRSLRHDGIDKVRTGLTSEDELRRVLGEAPR